MPRRVLVTGATGFIGSALCRVLLARGHIVRALHRPTSSLSALRGLEVERCVGDVLHPETLSPALEDTSWVFHAASQPAYWRYPEEVLRVAIEGTRNMMLASLQAGVERVVLTSSLSAMGIPAPGQVLTEEDTFDQPAHVFPYGYAKRQAELEALKVSQQGLDVVIVNPSVVIGAGDLNQVSGSLIVEIGRGRSFIWFEGGLNVVHLDDVVAGHLVAAERGRSRERYILGGHNMSHREIFTLIAEITGRRPPFLKIPQWTIPPAAYLVGLLARRVQLPIDANQLRLSRHYFYCDSSKARRELELAPPIPFRKAVTEAYHWYQDEGII